MIDPIAQKERRNEFRRKSDRNFRISIIMLIALVFLAGCSVGYYIAAKEAATMVINAEKEK